MPAFVPPLIEARFAAFFGQHLSEENAGLFVEEVPVFLRQEETRKVELMRHTVTLAPHEGYGNFSSIQ